MTRLAKRIDVYSLEAIGLRLHKTHVGPGRLASRDDIRQLVGDAAKAVPGHRFGRHFLLTEWEHVVGAWQLGQRLFPQPFSWKSLDVDIRGRSRTRRVNYRTSHRIRSQADRLLARQ